jgi:acyl-CoA synthetase (NDP forming)
MPMRERQKIQALLPIPSSINPLTLISTVWPREFRSALGAQLHSPAVAFSSK